MSSSFLQSIEKTGRLVIVSEAPGRGSVASDIAAWAAETLFDALKAPVRRVCGLVTPIPYNRALEEAVVPSVEDIVRSAGEVLGEKSS